MAHFVDIKPHVPSGGAREGDGLALLHLPIAVFLVPQLQESVLGVVPLAALRAGPVSAPSGTFAVKLLRDGKALPAAAWHKKHPGPRFWHVRHCSLMNSCSLKPEARSLQPEACSPKPAARSLQPEACSPKPAARSLTHKPVWRKGTQLMAGSSFKQQVRHHSCRNGRQQNPVAIMACGGEES